MYQIIVLGLGFLLVIGGGYLIKTTDKENVISKSISNEQIVDPAYLTLENVSGVYFCTKSFGCSTEYKLSLLQSGEAELTTSYDDGAEVLAEKGTWSLGSGGIMTILITDSQVEHYDNPRTFLIQFIGNSKLSKLSYDKNIYSNMNKPTFIKKITEI